jgi:hypothetical protein
MNASLPAVLRLAAVLVCSSALLCGNDTAATLGAGGLVPVKSAQIAMESEDLEISVHRITVKYRFRNLTNKDVDTIVEFPLPELNGGDVYNEPMNLPNTRDANFVDFQVTTSDGKRIPTQINARAFVDKRDVTERLKTAGVPVTVLLEPLNLALAKVPEAQRQQLVKEELLQTADFYPALRGVGEHGYWADWSMRVAFYWTQHFPANSTVELVQTYRPVVGGSYIYASDSGKRSVTPYCGTLKRWSGSKPLRRSCTSRTPISRCCTSARLTTYSRLPKTGADRSAISGFPSPPTARKTFC